MVTIGGKACVVDTLYILNSFFCFSAPLLQSIGLYASLGQVTNAKVIKQWQ